MRELTPSELEAVSGGTTIVKTPITGFELAVLTSRGLHHLELVLPFLSNLPLFSHPPTKI